MKTPEEIIKYIAYDMPIMKYYDNPEPKTNTLKKKRQDMIDNKDGLYIATEKHDGDFGLFAHFSKGNNLIRSRSISKVTGVYGDYTAKVPHLAEEMDRWPDNTVVLAELCWDIYGTNCNTVGTILRCLPAKAVERQKKDKLVGYVFDILMYDGQDLTDIGYYDRLTKWANLISVRYNNDDTQPYYFKRTAIFGFGIDFQEAADEIITAGGEGIVIQRLDNPYMPGTRTAWKTLKLKQSLPEMELKVIATIEPKSLYEGDFPENWPYKMDGIAVTKPFFYHWKNGVRVEYNDTVTDVTSGLTDEDREWLATAEAQEMIKNGELFAVVKGMATNDLGKIRHPYLVRLRNDL